MRYCGAAEALGPTTDAAFTCLTNSNKCHIIMILSCFCQNENCDGKVTTHFLIIISVKIITTGFLFWPYPAAPATTDDLGFNVACAVHDFKVLTTGKFIEQVDQVLPGHYNTFGAKRLHRIASTYISRAGTCPAKFSTFAWRTLAGVALRACNPRSAC